MNSLRRIIGLALLLVTFHQAVVPCHCGADCPTARAEFDPLGCPSAQCADLCCCGNHAHGPTDARDSLPPRDNRHSQCPGCQPRVVPSTAISFRLTLEVNALEFVAVFAELRTRLSGLEAVRSLTVPGGWMMSRTALRAVVRLQV